jgi:hypothetical protein
MQSTDFLGKFCQLLLISCPQAVTMFVVRTSVRIMRTEVRTTNRFYCDRPIALASLHKPGFSPSTSDAMRLKNRVFGSTRAIENI